MTKNYHIIVVLLLLVASIASAQAPGGRQRDSGPRRGFGGPPDFHLMNALDANRDGRISAAEIEGAVAALQKLDKDKDGKLSSSEIGWPPSFGGGFRGFRGGGGRGGTGVPGFDGQGPPQRPDPDQTEQASSEPGRAARSATFFSASQLKRLDRNGDGRITKQEIPRRMQDLILNRVDSDKDGEIDQQELDELDGAEK